MQITKYLAIPHPPKSICGAGIVELLRQLPIILKLWLLSLLPPINAAEWAVVFKFYCTMFALGNGLRVMCGSGSSVDNMLVWSLAKTFRRAASVAHGNIGGHIVLLVALLNHAACIW